MCVVVLEGIFASVAPKRQQIYAFFGEGGPLKRGGGDKPVFQCTFPTSQLILLALLPGGFVLGHIAQWNCPKANM